MSKDNGSLAKPVEPPSHLPTYRAQEPWTALLWENTKLFGLALLCAGGSGAIAKTAVAPLERVKLLMQVQAMSNTPATEQYKGLWDAWRRIPKREGGIRALYRGNAANIARLPPDVLFKFAVYDQFRLMFAPADGTPSGLTGKLAAGAATGFTKTMLFYPLDLCRTRITSDLSPAGSSRCYSGIRQCLWATLRREGLRGWYKGLTLSLVGVVPYLSISFTAYDEFKRRLPRQKDTWYAPFLKMGCGAAASVTAQTITYPLDTLRRRIQLNGALGQAVTYSGYFDCAGQMLRNEGLRSFYRGSLINCVKTVPGAALQFIAYDLLKVAVTRLDPTTGNASPL